MCERMIFMEEHNNALIKSLGEAGNDLAESKEKNWMKESCIRALTDLNKEMKVVVDAQQKEIEMALTTSQQHYIGEKESIREILMKVETWCELIKDLRAEADALRQEMIGMVNNSFGPSAIGYEKLRRSFDRQDRVRLRPFSEGAGDNYANLL